MSIQKAGRYEIIRELGQGGQSVAYLAQDPVIGRMVAIKLMKSLGAFTNVTQQEYTQRFLREAQAAGRLMHGNIAVIYDVGEAEGAPFIAMEFIEGQTLGSLLKREFPLPLDRVVRLMTQVLSGLGYAHKHNIIHRDIKPGNIMVTDNDVVKLVDFGIAKLDSSQLTNVGHVLGTPSYMSPEQITGEKVDRRSDIFSAGVVLYQILAGRLPFEGEHPTTVIYKIMHEPYAPLKIDSTLFPPQMDGILFKAMAKRPEDRYSDCAAMEKELSALLVSQPKQALADLEEESTISLELKSVPRQAAPAVPTAAAPSGPARTAAASGPIGPPPVAPIASAPPAPVPAPTPTPARRAPAPIAPLPHPAAVPVASSKAPAPLAAEAEESPTASADLAEAPAPVSPGLSPKTLVPVLGGLVLVLAIVIAAVLWGPGRGKEEDAAQNQPPVTEAVSSGAELSTSTLPAAEESSSTTTAPTTTLAAVAESKAGAAGKGKSPIQVIIAPQNSPKGPAGKGGSSASSGSVPVTTTSEPAAPPTTVDPKSNAASAPASATDDRKADTSALLPTVWRIPVTHDHLVGGCQGTLIITTDSLEYFPQKGNHYSKVPLGEVGRLNWRDASGRFRLSLQLKAGREINYEAEGQADKEQLRKAYESLLQNFLKQQP